MRQGLLYSQIGYDIGDPMKAYFRSDRKEALGENAYFTVVNQANEETFSHKPSFFGEKWNTYWWVLDFSGIQEPCTIKIHLFDDSNVEIKTSSPIQIDFNLIWNKTIKSVALDALEERAKRARNQIGWKDCGSDFREVSSVTPPIIALCDLLNKAFEEFTLEEQERIQKQIMVGCDYLCGLMDVAERFGLPKGSIVHDVPNFMITIPGDLGNSVVALTKAATNLSELYPEKAGLYLSHAKATYDYILNELEPIGYVGINYEAHGMEDGQELPNEFMTRDLLLFMWGGILLWKAGQKQYENDVLRFAEQIMARQIPESEAEDGLYGHFYLFDSLKISEKTWCHHHVGHDTGGILPNYLIPFFEMYDIWYNHKDSKLWEKMIVDFATGYFIPACQKNPFHLLPIGYYKNEGWLNFCGPWHGFNATIGFSAKLALELRSFVEDDTLIDIAVSAVQWICGANAGLTSDSFDSCVFWKEEIPQEEALSYSQIVGIGTRSVRCWTDIVGTIPNGFCVNPQFQFKVKPSASNDEPIRYTDEDWIPHSAGFISALIALNGRHFWRYTQPRSREVIAFNKRK